MPVFRQMIALKGQKPLLEKEAMLEQLALVFSLEQESFRAIYRDKHKKALIPAHQVSSYLQNFLNQLESLSRHLDSL